MTSEWLTNMGEEEEEGMTDPLPSITIPDPDVMAAERRRRHPTPFECYLSAIMINVVVAIQEAHRRDQTFVTIATVDLDDPHQEHLGMTGSSRHTRLYLHLDPGHSGTITVTFHETILEYVGRTLTAASPRYKVTGTQCCPRGPHGCAYPYPLTPGCTSGMKVSWE